MVLATVPASAAAAALPDSGYSRVAAPVHAVQATPWYNIQFRDSGKCVYSPNNVDGAQLVQRQCNSSDARQLWGLFWTSGGYAGFVNYANGKCINVQGASTANEAPIVQWPCDFRFDNDEWYGQPTGPGSIWYWFRARHSQMCMVVRWASWDEGAPLIQYTCTGGDRGNDEITYIYSFSTS